MVYPNAESPRVIAWARLGLSTITTRKGGAYMTEQRQQERRRRRQCPSCGGSNMIRGCKVPGVQLQIVREDSGQRSGLIALYSDVCVDCGLTSFYARRTEVAHGIEGLEQEGPAVTGQ